MDPHYVIDVTSTSDVRWPFAGDDDNDKRGGNFFAVYIISFECFCWFSFVFAVVVVLFLVIMSFLLSVFLFLCFVQLVLSTSFV